jgi:hypothetical protein
MGERGITISFTEVDLYDRDVFPDGVPEVFDAGAIAEMIRSDTRNTGDLIREWDLHFDMGVIVEVHGPDGECSRAEVAW